MNPPETHRDDDEGLAQLSSDLRAERPEIDPEFAAQLDAWAAAGFPRAERPGKAGGPRALERLRARLSATPPRRLLAPVGAVATLVVVVGLAISVGTQPNGGDQAATFDAAEGGGEVAPATPEVEDRAADSDLQDAATPEAGATALRDDRPGLAEKAVPLDDRKIATTADLVLATEPDEVRTVSDEVNEVVNRYRGIVVSSSVQSGDTEGPGLGSNFQLRIPAANLKAALADLSELAHVQSRTESTEDITGKFIGSQERIDELEASRESVLNQLAEADTEEEADALRRKLQSLNAQLSAVRAELEDARQRVQLVPVSVSIVAEEGAGDDGDWGVSEALDDAGRVLSTAAGVALVAGAVLLPLALIALLAALVLRTRTGRARERALDE
jgi:Domain of unknown function (DUF4349)